MILSILVLLGLLALATQLAFNSKFQNAIFTFLGRNKVFFTLLFAGLLVLINSIGIDMTLKLAPMALGAALQFAMAILFMFVQFGAMMYFMSRARKYTIMPGEGRYTFNDYRGNPQVLERAKEVVRLLKAAKDPELKKTGVQPVRGVLLEGDPGSGKSFLGQCIANEAGVPFHYISAPSMQQAFMGMSALTVWRLYNTAGKQADNPQYGAAIIFIDEIDAIGQKRSGGNAPAMGMMGGMMGMGGGSQILNELLTQMDPPDVPRGFIFKLKNNVLKMFGRPAVVPTRPTILTMGATNLVRTLDDALLRPGRFDRIISVDYPDADGRLDILTYYLSKVSNTVKPEEVLRLVRRTKYYSPVRLKTMVNEGLIGAISDGRRAATFDDIMRAQDVMEFGVPQPIRNMSYEDQRRIAYHEAGHAVVAVLLRRTMLVEIATIVRRGDALGLVGSKPNEERYTATKDEMMENIDVCVASRAVEELFLGIQMNGFSGDLQQATNTAVSMITMFGMGRRMISYAALGMQHDPRVIGEAATLIEVRFRLIKEFIKRNEKAVKAVAEALLEHKDLDGPVVVDLVKENAAFTPIDLADELSALLDDDGREYLASAWSERLVKKGQAEESDDKSAHGKEDSEDDKESEDK